MANFTVDALEMWLQYLQTVPDAAQKLEELGVTEASDLSLLDEDDFRHIQKCIPKVPISLTIR